LRKPDLIDNIYFWLGECSFQKNNFSDAISNFKNVLLQPKANKAEDALWKLGLTNEKMNRVEDAREYFQRLIDSFPKSRYLNRAKAKLKTLI
jgi:TolA-binding protein